MSADVKADMKEYPPLLKMAADMIEPVVNASLATRKRYPLEYAGAWRANVCGANRYDGAGSGWVFERVKVEEG